MQHDHVRPHDLRQRLPVGTVLDGAYVVEGEIGSGGFGITYRGRDRMLGHAVAIKEYFPSEVGSRDSTMSVHPVSSGSGEVFEWGRDSFVREAQMLATFKHPGIVRVLRYFVANNTAYMVLEYEEGQTLASWLKECARDPSGDWRGLPPQEDLDLITKGLCDALAQIHERRLIHRDIAPDNIIVRNDGSPVLLDFGAARYEVAGHTRLSGQAVHTTSYAIVKSHYSPLEQRSTDTTKRGPWSDIYALGATLYRAVTGAAPLDATDRIASEADPLVPAVDAAKAPYRASFLEAIDKALAVKPADRPQTVEAFRELAFRKVAPVAAQPKSDPEATADTGPPTLITSVDAPQSRLASTSPNPRRPMRITAAVAALGLVGLAGGAWWFGGGAGTKSADNRAAVADALIADAPAKTLQSIPASPAAPADPRAAVAEADEARRAAAATLQAEQAAAAERQEVEARRRKEEADRQAAETRRQRDELEQRRIADARQAADNQRRLEAERAEAERTRQAQEQARQEQQKADQRRIEDEARITREREQAAAERERATRDAQAAQPADEAKALAAKAAPPATPSAPVQQAENIAAVATTLAPTTPTVSIERRANWSTKGEGYNRTLGTTYADCEARCLADPACQSLEFFKPKRQCNLYVNVPLDGPTKDADVGIKRAAASEAPIAAASAAPKAAPSRAGRIVRLRNRFFEGDGYRKITRTTFHACERLCLADATCKALELHRKGNVCQLYATVPKQGSSSDADIGVKR